MATMWITRNYKFAANCIWWITSTLSISINVSTWMCWFPSVFFLCLYKNRTFEDKWHMFYGLRSFLSGCHLISSIKALKETQTPNTSLSGLILSLSTTNKRLLLPISWLSDASSTTILRLSRLCLRQPGWASDATVIEKLTKKVNYCRSTLCLEKSNP